MSKTKFAMFPKLPIMTRGSIVDIKTRIFTRKAFENEEEENNQASKFNSMFSGYAGEGNVELEKGTKVVYVKNEQLYESGKAFIQIFLLKDETLLAFDMIKLNQSEWNSYTLAQKKEIINTNLQKYFSIYLEGNNTNDKQ